MASPILSALFPGAEPLAFRCQLNGKVFCTQWTRYLGETAGIHSFELLLEVDPSVLGSGGELVRARSRLDCDATLQPLRYNSETAGAVVLVSFAADSIQVTLPNGTQRSFPRDGAEWVMETYMIGLDALLYASAMAQGRLAAKALFKIFFVNQLMVTPYKAKPAELPAEPGVSWFKTSFDEEVQLDQQGVMRLVRNPKYGIDTILVRPAPPLPSWQGEMLMKRVKLARYTRPADARFASQDVVIPASEVAIGATLTVPPSAGPHPAVLFLPGSGLLDRNGLTGEVDLGSHEIVDHLSSSGFVGLRFDKRGAGTTPRGPDPERATSLEAIIDDATAALAFLRARPDVDPKRVFLVGHSEGATVALVLAGQRHAEVAGIVLLGSRGRGMDEVSLAQAEATARHKGQSEEQIQAQLADMRRFFDLVKAGGEWKADQIPDALYLGARSVPWLRDHFRYPVEQLITQIKCPVAIFHGESDFQVPIVQAAELAERARTAKVAVTFKALPALDHLFKPVEGESTAASYFTDRRVDAGFLADLTSWLKAQSAS